MTDIQATLIAGIGGAIVGGAIGIIGTYFGSIKITQRQEFNKAAVAFHAEFADVIYHLAKIVNGEPNRQKNIFQIINTHDLAKYDRAVILFRPFLYGDEATIVGFNNAWATYKQYMKATEDQYADYQNPPDASQERAATIATESPNPIQEYLNHIYNLLSYAQRK